jgi:integrase
MKRLPSAPTVAKLREPGRYAVGHGAYLQVSEWGTKAWIFRYVRNGKARHVGMGSAIYVTLSEARERAFEYRRMLVAGIDPLEAKRTATHEQRIAAVRAKSFKQCALEYIAAHEAGWRGDGSRRQWVESLHKHVFPRIGDMPVAKIDIAAVLSVLDAMHDIPETQNRVRHRIASVLDWAAARELRAHDNPARRPKLLPPRKRHVEHFAAMDYRQLPSFMAQLRAQSGASARCLELMILTASRPGETLGARWSEIEGDVWTIPDSRMKSGRPHRVPLSSPAVAVLAELRRDGAQVFPGTGSDGHLTRWAFRHLLKKRMGRDEVAHGFRASFKTWASERTNFPRELIEAALAHVIGDAAEQAYSRGDMLARRRQLMEAWSEYCSLPAVAAEIVPIRKVEVPA